jgi:hypothetical protein
MIMLALLVCLFSCPGCQPERITTPATSDQPATDPDSVKHARELVKKQVENNYQGDVSSKDLIAIGKPAVPIIVEALEKHKDTLPGTCSKGSFRFPPLVMQFNRTLNSITGQKYEIKDSSQAESRNECVAFWKAYVKNLKE